MEKKDEDVLNEANRVGESSTESMAIRVNQLRKEYKSACKRGHHTAVRNLSFGIENGECFALLGVNGAGKTTIFKVLMN